MGGGVLRQRITVNLQTERPTAWIKLERGRRALRRLPEGRPIFQFSVERERCQQLPRLDKAGWVDER